MTESEHAISLHPSKERSQQSAESSHDVFGTGQVGRVAVAELAPESTQAARRQRRCHRGVLGPRARDTGDEAMLSHRLSCNAKTCPVAVKEAAVKKRLRPSSAHKPETVLPCQGWTVTGWVSFKLLVGQHHAQDADVGTRGSPAHSQTIMQCKNMSCGSQGSCGKKALAPSPCEKT